MDIIKWRVSYETGINAMDEQHQKLIELINTLYRVIRNKEAGDSMEKVLAEMSKYAEKHLREEEALLEENNYPDYAKHSSLHQNYRDKLKGLVSELQGEDESTAQDAYRFLRQWWMEHIVNEDKKYGKFLNSKGIS